MDAYELMLGIDEVEIDDSLLVQQLRNRKFINVKSMRKMKDSPTWYMPSDAKDSDRPLMVAYIGLGEHGIRYQRFVSGWMNLLSDVGGLMLSLNNIMIVLVSVLCTIKQNSKLIILLISQDYSLVS